MKFILISVMIFIILEYAGHVKSGLFPWLSKRKSDDDCTKALKNAGLRTDGESYNFNNNLFADMVTENDGRIPTDQFVYSYFDCIFYKGHKFSGMEYCNLCKNQGDVFKCFEKKNEE